MKSETYIVLEKVKFYSYHGVDSQENVVGAYFIVDLKLKIDFTLASGTDELENTVSYADVFQILKEEMNIPSKLLEHVGRRMTERLFREFMEVEEVELKLIKENPPMGADSAGAGIIMKCVR